MAGVPERIYQPNEQLGSATPTPYVSGEAFGTGLGAAVEQGGNVLHQDRVRALRVEKERQQESDNAAAGVAAAQLSVDLTSDAQAARDDAPLDGAGHVDKVATAADARVTQFLGSIKDERVRQHWTARAAELRGNLVEQEDGWQRGRRIEAIGTNVREAGRLWDNQLQGNPDPQAFDQALKDVDTMLEGVNAPADIKDKLSREQKANRAQNYGRGLVEKNPGAGLAVLKSGMLDHWLSADDKKVLVGEAETGVRVAAADLRRQQSQAEQQLNQDITEFSQRVTRDGELPSDQEAAELIARAQTLAPNRVDDIRHDVGTLKLSRETDKWTPADWSGHVDPLAAKVAGGKASAQEQQQLKILQELRPAKEARFLSNPRQAAAASGIPVPDFDPDNPTPQSVAAQASFAEAWQKTAHLPEAPYEPKPKLDAYRQQASQGPVSQLEIASELRQTWGAARGSSIVRQIGGEAKADMLVMVGLEPRMADLYRKGIEQLKLPGFKFDDGRAQEIFQQFRYALPTELQGPVFNAAKAITAGYAAEGSLAQAGGGNFDHAFSVAVHRAVGMLGDPTGRSTGGFVRWNGRNAVLPQDMARTDLQTRISRAAPQDWVNAAVDPRGNPVHAVPHHLGPDGKLKPYTKGEAVRFGQAPLETVAPGIYRLIGADGRPVVDQHGQPWQFDVRRLNGAAATSAGRPVGLRAPGNIDIHHRPVVHNADGSYSTVLSFSIGTPQGEVLIPRVVGGKVVSEKDATRHYMQTGEHLGIFDTPQHATAYAKSLHEHQAREYRR